MDTEKYQLNLTEKELDLLSLIIQDPPVFDTEEALPSLRRKILERDLITLDE